MRKAQLLLVTLVGWTVASTAAARAPDTFEEEYQKPAIIDSPMWWAFELKVGPYRPGDSGEFRRTFGSDQGWLLSLELDVTVFPIPYVGQINVGAGWGWANFDARAFTVDGSRSGESTELTIYPLSALAVLRVDALARHTFLPFTFAGKLGYDFVIWSTSTGANQPEADGLNKGLRWAAQAALELDFLERSAARRLDEEWEINHTFLLFEFYESMTKGTGDRTFSFGFGAQF